MALSNKPKTQIVKVATAKAKAKDNSPKKNIATKPSKKEPKAQKKTKQPSKNKK